MKKSLLLLFFIQVGFAERSLSNEIKPGESDDSSDSFFGNFRELTLANTVYTGSDTCPCLTEEQITARSNTTEVLTGFGSCKWEENCSKANMNTAGDCALQKCVVDPLNCNMQYKPIDSTNGLAWSYNTCGFRTPNQKESLEGRTLKIMLVSESAGWWGYYSNFCRGPIGDTPAACSGLSTVVLSNLQSIGKFDVEYHQVLPDQFWTAVIDFCRAYEHPDYGKPEWDDSDYSYKSHLCLSQVWSICIYAAAIGYVDWCPHAAFQSVERLGWLNGIEYHPQVYNLYSRQNIVEDAFDSIVVILNEFSMELYIIIFFWVFLNSLLVRWTAGYYEGFSTYKPDRTFEKYGFEILDILWYGWGMFIDLVYPQLLPSGGSKCIILIFEFVQLILFACITASITNLLLSQDSTMITDLEDLAPAGKYLCFYQEIAMITYEEAHPEQAHIPKRAYKSYKELDADLSCAIASTTGEEIKTQKGVGVMCNFEYLKGDRMENHFSAINQGIFEPLYDAWSIYKETNYEEDYDRMLQNAISPPACIVPTPVFKSVGLKPFVPFFKWSAICIAICFVCHIPFYFMEETGVARNFEMIAYFSTTDKESKEPYTFSYFNEGKK